MLKAARGMRSRYNAGKERYTFARFQKAWDTVFRRRRQSGAWRHVKERERARAGLLGMNNHNMRMRLSLSAPGQRRRT